MSDLLLPPPLLSASETPSSSTDSSSDSSDSSDSSTSSASVRLSPLPEADEDDVGEIGVTGSRSPLNAFVETGVNAAHTQLMLDLRLLGFRCHEAEAVEADKIEGAAVEAEADRAVEDEANKVRGVSVEAEDDRVVESEADNVVMGDEAENEGLTKWRRVTVAEGCQVRGSFMNERFEGFGLADGWQTRGGRAGRDKGDKADVRQTMGSGLKMSEKIKDGADERHIGERKRDDTERGLLVAKRFRACTRAAVLAESLGLGSSSDSEGDEVDEGRFGAEGSLAMMADERHLMEVEGSTVRVGERESEGLTEEVGVSRREALDPGMLDEVWLRKTLALNGEDVANTIYHIPKGYRLPLPPKGSSIHDPPDAHVGVYLKDLEFGLRFPLVDEIVQIIS